MSSELVTVLSANCNCFNSWPHRIVIFVRFSSDDFWNLTLDKPGFGVGDLVLGARHLVVVVVLVVGEPVVAAVLVLL